MRRIEAACAEHGVAPGALALQFSMREPRIASTIVGVSSVEHVAQSLAWASAEVPPALWTAIESFEYSTDDPEANREYKPG